jgi:hypothetical protein
MGCRSGSAVRHALQLLPQRQRLPARLPGMRHHLHSCFVIALDRASTDRRADRHDRRYRRASHRRRAARSGQTDRSPSRGMKHAVENLFEKSENLSARILGPQAPASVRKAKIASRTGQVTPRGLLARCAGVHVDFHAHRHFDNLWSLPGHLNLHFESGHTKSQFQNGQKSELLFVALSKTDEHRLPIAISWIRIGYLSAVLTPIHLKE